MSNWTASGMENGNWITSALAIETVGDSVLTASESWLIVIGSVPATPSIRQPRCLHVEVGVIGQDRPAHAEIGRLVWSTEISSEKGTLWNVKRKSELIESDQRTDIDDDDIRGTGLTRE